MSHPIRLTAVSLVALAVATGAAYAQLADGALVDLDQDGKISRKEVGEATLIRFDNIDTNADGFISVDELNNEALIRFDNADADGDGYLTRREMRAMAQSRLSGFRK